MKKLILLITLILTLLLATIIAIAFALSWTTEQATEAEFLNVSAWTKAICDNTNLCMDVLVTCENGKITDMKPTGSWVQFDGNWTDPRPDSIRDSWC